MNFIAYDSNPPRAGVLVAGSASPERAASVVAVAAGIPEAAADAVTVRLEADGVATGVALTIAAGQTTASASVSGVTVAAGALLRWRCTAAGPLVAAPQGITASAQLQAVDGLALPWSVLFRSAGPVLASDADASRLTGLVVLPVAAMLGVVQAEAVSAGAGATLVGLESSGVAVPGLTVEFPDDPSPGARVVTGTWARAMPAGSRLTVRAMASPPAPEACLVDFSLWIRVTAEG